MDSIENSILKYYKNFYKRRNDILYSMVLPHLGNNIKILDSAPGSSYIAERFLKLSKVEKYTWNDMNSNLIDYVSDRIDDDRFIINSNRVEDVTSSFDDTDLFICVSLEHIENDIQLIERIKPGTVVAICSPNFNSASHFRFFEKVDEFEERYSKYLDIQSISTLIKVIPRKINPDKILKKYIMVGIKKEEEAWQSEEVIQEID